MLFLRLGLRVVSARAACRPRSYATSSVTINRVAPEATVGVREAVLWPGRPDMCRLAEDEQGHDADYVIVNIRREVQSLSVLGQPTHVRASGP